MKWENLTFAYGDHVILRDLMLELPARGVTGLMGASGVGKSTLLRVLAGLEKKAAGQITDPPERVSILFQDDRLFPHLTVLENLTLILKDRAQAEDWLKKVRLDDAADRLPAALSGGMKRRVALARALAYPSDLLLLDEPLGGLDAALCEQMGDLIRAEGAKRAVLVSLHSEADAERISDRILLLQDGQLIEKTKKSPV